MTSVKASSKARSLIIPNEFKIYSGILNSKRIPSATNDWTINTTIAAGQENVTYTYTDRNANAAVTYYRIKLVNTDGTPVYAAVKVIRDNEVKVSANVFAANKNVNVELSQQVKTLVVKVSNLNGRVIANQTVNNATGKVSINLNQLTAGIYVVCVTDNNGLQKAVKVSIS